MWEALEDASAFHAAADRSFAIYRYGQRRERALELALSAESVAPAVV